jgi:hypothetical protein
MADVDRTPRRVGVALLVGVFISALNVVSAAAAGTAPVSPWQPVAFPSQLHPGAMLLLTTGSVMVQDQGPANGGASGWWLLTPGAKGSYVNGTWHRLASLPPGYGPLSFASAVLPDGRVIIEGGEDNLGHASTFTNLGAIYQPLTNRWTPVAPPAGSEWGTIGDAPATVLTNGTFMLGGSGNFSNTTQALLNPKTLTWTITGTHKVDDNEEEGFTLLPNDRVLTVGLRPNADYTEIYDPATGNWTDAGKIPVPIVDTVGGELGPLVLRPNGTVLVLGATGQNAVYDVATQTWAPGPSFPVIDGKQPHCADAPAAVLPDGNVLIDASPGLYQPPSHFFVFNGRSLARVTDAPNAADLQSNFGYMLVLPTGQILFNDRDGHMEVYTDSGRPNASWRPVIRKVATTLVPGTNYSVTGSQLNGLTQGAYYGDDYQSATNYPLVRVTYDRTGRVFYARTFDMSSMAVTPMSPSHAQFQIPTSASRGKATLVVVANGISSSPDRRVHSLIATLWGR